MRYCCVHCSNECAVIDGNIQRCPNHPWAEPTPFLDPPEEDIEQVGTEIEPLKGNNGI